ncbi:VIT multi-domain protein [Pyrenophora tritici-repentis]|nr:VIT multi-domain protein [Pyrenophora tritici-repentis]
MNTHSSYSPTRLGVCGCYIYDARACQRTYLPQVKLESHTTILSTASRTVMRQKFVNQSDHTLKEIRYAFPLFDGISVVDFVCHIGQRTIYGLVKERREAKKTYDVAKTRGETAALLEQDPDAADVFKTTISNIPNGSSIFITIKYIQELNHDAEVDGIRLTIPSSIFPRYGYCPGNLQKRFGMVAIQGISITVDVCMPEGIPIRKIISQSHPIEVTLGSLSTSTIDEDVSISRGSAVLALQRIEFRHDFILRVVAKDIGIPQAILKTHPTLPNQRALMTTLVPKFNLKTEKPEIIFIVDRSGSMSHQIPTLVSALKVFLKSIPVGCMFNICSFGSSHSCLWSESKGYNQETLEEAINCVDAFQADMGGTETLAAVQSCFKMRNKHCSTEMVLLTDGNIWAQQQLFNYIIEETKSGDVRVFPIGIGGQVSSALIEGVARAGGGFAEMVAENEKLDRKIIRILKDKENKASNEQPNAEPISLYDTAFQEEHTKVGEPTDIFAGLPNLKRPALLQTPHEIPQRFPFHRTCVYLLLASESSHLKPKSVVLKGTSPQGPLTLEIPIEIREEADEMIHQLAARKATQELEEDHGWISKATVDNDNVSVKDKYRDQFALLQRREAVRLGVEFQVGGKYCSFVAVEANEAEIVEKRKQAREATVSRDLEELGEDWDVVESSSFSPVSRHFVSQRESLRLATPSSYFGEAKFCSAGSADPPAAQSWPHPRVSGITRVRRGSRGRSSGGRGGGRGGGFANTPSAGIRSTDQNTPGSLYSSTTGWIPPLSSSSGFHIQSNPPSSPTPCPSPPLLHRLIAHQLHNGSFPATAPLPYLEMSISPSVVRNSLRLLTTAPTAAAYAEVLEQLLTTAIVVVYLENKMQEEVETWELVVGKARAWVQEVVEGTFLEELWKVAGEVVRAWKG